MGIRDKGKEIKGTKGQLGIKQKIEGEMRKAKTDHEEGQR